MALGSLPLNSMKQIRDSLKLELWLSTICIVIVLLASALWENCLYLDGRRLSDFSIVLIAVALVFGAVGFAIPTLRLYFRRRLQNRRGKICRVSLIALAFLATAHMLLVVVRKPGYIAFTDGFASRIKEAIKPNQLQQIQEWATVLLITNSAPFQEVLYKDLPTFVRDLEQGSGRPRVFIDTRAYSNLRLVALEFGGGFGSFGVFVGPKGTTLASEDSVYIVKWADGVYVYHSKH